MRAGHQESRSKRLCVGSLALLLSMGWGCAHQPEPDVAPFRTLKRKPAELGSAGTGLPDPEAEEGAEDLLSVESALSIHVGELRFFQVRGEPLRALEHSGTHARILFELPKSRVFETGTGRKLFLSAVVRIEGRTAGVDRLRLVFPDGALRTLSVRVLER